MPATDSNTLLNESKCFACIGATQTDMLKISLLIRKLKAVHPAADVTPNGLLDYGKCYACLGLSPIETVMIALLDQIVN